MKLSASKMASAANFPASLLPLGVIPTTNALFRHDEAIARAAAPFAGGVAMVAAADPGIVSEGVPTHARRQHDCNLMRPFPADLMRMWPISTMVNKPENDDSSIIEPIELGSA
jgi:hypothetical protein